MNPKCDARHEDEHSVYHCTLYSGHTGDHKHVGRDGELYKQWPRLGSGSTAKWYVPDELEMEKPIVLRLSLEELKGLVYALSGPEWKEDEPELVAKIDKALKEAL